MQKVSVTKHPVQFTTRDSIQFHLSDMARDHGVVVGEVKNALHKGRSSFKVHIFVLRSKWHDKEWYILRNEICKKFGAATYFDNDVTGFSCTVTRVSTLDYVYDQVQLFFDNLVL